MALYELTEEQALNTKTLLQGVTIQGNRAQRKEFDSNIDAILAALDKPILPADVNKKKK
jgi:hypothetical protein